MSRREPQDPFETHEPFDAVEMVTEGGTDEEELSDNARLEEAAAGEPEASEPNLLERALRKAGSDAARYIPVRFVPALTSVVTTPLFTAYIKPDDYGAFSLISIIASLLAAVAVQWLQQSSIRFYWPARKEGKLDGYISTTVWIGFGSLAATAAVVGTATWFGRGWVDPIVPVRLLPVALAYFIAHFYITAMLQVLRAAKRASAYAVLTIVVTLLVTVASIWLVVRGWGSAGILAGAAIGNLVVAPLVLWQLRKEGSLSPARVDAGVMRDYLTFGMPLVPAAVATWALVVLDRPVIQHFAGLGAVGIYSVAYNLGDKIMQLSTMPLLLTMMPSIYEAYELRGQPIAERMQTHFTRYFAILTLPLLAALAAVSTVFMKVFTSGEFQSAYAILPLVAAGSMFGSFAQIAGAGLGIHKRTKLIMADTLIAAAFNVGLNVAFIPVFGYRFAALSTTLGYALLFSLMWWQSRRYMRWDIPWGPLGRVAGASLAMGGALLALTLTVGPHLVGRWSNLGLLTVQAVLGIALYTVLLVAFGGLRPEERAFIGELGRKGWRKLTGRAA